KKIGPDPRNFNQRVSLGRNDLLIRTFLNEFFDRGIWRLIWKNACTFRLRWRLGRRYLRIKRYRHAG
ncbi:hypothetical protein LZ597_19715, partial [Klebsiella pneumoniae]|nr:hypothetical protein [Klebsiella pneumoniae]